MAYGWHQDLVDEVASDLHHDLEFEEVVQCDEHPDLEVEMASDPHHDWEVEEVVDVVLVALYVVSLVAQAAS